MAPETASSTAIDKITEEWTDSLCSRFLPFSFKFDRQSLNDCKNYLVFYFFTLQTYCAVKICLEFTLKKFFKKSWI